VMLLGQMPGNGVRAGVHPVPRQLDDQLHGGDRDRGRLSVGRGDRGSNAASLSLR
jgi:hypothetical protein